MAKIKQSALNEIHWKLPGWNQGADANARLQSLLRDASKYFANVNVGPSAVFWNHPDSDWTCVTTATADERPGIEAAQRRVSQLVQSRAGKYAEMLLTRPNEDYIFFRTTPSGTTEILYTGWGYSNYKKASGGAFRKVNETAQTHPATVAFTVDGTPVPMRSFEVVLPGGRTNTLATDAEGRYVFPMVTPGNKATLRDVESGKTFEFVWDKERKEYLFDVTPEYVPEEESEEESEEVLPPPPPPAPEPKPQPITLRIVNHKGQPFVNGKVSLSAPGARVDGTLDKTGAIRFETGKFHPGMPITTSLVAGSNSFPSIVWCIEEGENDYLLEEAAPAEDYNIWKELAVAVACLAGVVLVGAILF